MGRVSGLVVVFFSLLKLELLNEECINCYFFPVVVFFIKRVAYHLIDTVCKEIPYEKKTGEGFPDFCRYSYTINTTNNVLLPGEKKGGTADV